MKKEMSQFEKILEKLEEHGELLLCLKTTTARVQNQILGDKDAGIKGIAAKLDDKADAKDFDEVKRKVDRHGKYIETSKYRYAKASGAVAVLILLWEFIKDKIGL